MNHWESIKIKTSRKSRRATLTNIVLCSKLWIFRMTDDMEDSTALRLPYYLSLLFLYLPSSPWICRHKTIMSFLLFVISAFHINEKSKMSSIRSNSINIYLTRDVKLNLKRYFCPYIDCELVLFRTVFCVSSIRSMHTHTFLSANAPWTNDRTSERLNKKLNYEKYLFDFKCRMREWEVTAIILHGKLNACISETVLLV